MITDWKKEIATAWYIQNETSKLDVEKQWDYYLPSLAATEQDLTFAERIIKHPLDLRYRQFLSFANGWRCFYQRVDLFGTKELIDDRMRSAMSLMEEIAPEVFAKSGVVKSQLLPIASSSTDIDLFVITRPISLHPGRVIWFAGEEIDRFATFDAFFLAMVDYNRLRYARFKNQGMKRGRV
jgi:hypothetical protein